MLNLAPTTDGKTYLQRTWEHIDINHVAAFQKSTSVINTSLEIVDSVESLIKVLKTEECYLAWSLWENWSFQQGQWKLKNKEIEYSLHFF